MRQPEDRQLRDFEIRQWFYLLRKQHLSEGMTPADATEQTYDDIGMRFSLRRTSIRRAKNAAAWPGDDHPHLMFEVKNNLSRLKQIVSNIEKALGEHQ